MNPHSISFGSDLVLYTNVLSRQEQHLNQTLAAADAVLLLVVDYSLLAHPLQGIPTGGDHRLDCSTIWV